MNIHLLDRKDDGCSLYVDGNLQFDSRDEGIYHESLVLPALGLAGSPKSVLICGGGDGLALRDILRFPGIEHVTLVDCSPEMIEIARTKLSELNEDAFEDSRMNLVIADALTYELAGDTFDVIICDFTFPTTLESAQCFSQEWYTKLKSALTPDGVMAINGVSPQNTPSAFACLVTTIKSAGLHVLPYHVCIPSFRMEGYGAWGFVMAAKKPLTIKALKSLSCPGGARHIDIGKLWRSARFSRDERRAFSRAPINRDGSYVLHGLLLNPQQVRETTPPDYPNLLELVEVRHPYHSRNMIETLAEQIAGTLPSLNLRKLVDELSQRAARLPDKVREELEALRDYLSRTILDLDVWGRWATRLLATLIIVMTVANSLSPDVAFAKGGEGMGHSSFSRGFTSTHTAGVSEGAPPVISSSGFRSGYGSGPVDATGYHYNSMSFHYYPHSYGYYGGYGYGGGYGNRGASNLGGHRAPIEHNPLFVLDDDLMLMDNGDVIVTLSPQAFLLITEGTASLVNSKTGTPLVPIYAEPKLFESIQQEIQYQTVSLEAEIKKRKDWLSWVGWTDTIFDTVRGDELELKNMQDMRRKVAAATQHFKPSPEKNSLNLPTGAAELFVGCHLLEDKRIELYGPGGAVSYLDGTNVTSADGKKTPITPEVYATIGSVIKKLIDEDEKDLVSYTKELADADKEIASINNDYIQYEQLATQYGYDSDVDYGTDTVSAQQAIQLTQKDLTAAQNDKNQLQTDRTKQQNELYLLKQVAPYWGV